MKRLLLGCFCILFCSFLHAQSPNLHTVSRGETPESIATYYGLTVEELKEANPTLDFSEYFYVGMKLNIPGKDKKKSKSGRNKKDKDVAKDEVKSSEPEEVISEKYMLTPLVSKRLGGSKFSGISLMVGGESTDLTGGYYSIRGQYFLPSGFGATLVCASTYGFSDTGDLIFKIGPSYVYSIKKWLYVEGALAYTLTVANTSYNSGLVSGVSLMPEIGFSFGKFRLGVGLEGLWRNGGSATWGCYLGVGYAFK